MSQEFINGILIGAGTTAFGFVLTMLWDNWKTREQRKDLQNNLINLLSDELDYNFSVVKRDESLIEQELKNLKESKSIVNVLDLPRRDFWEVFKLNYDQKFFSYEKVKIIQSVYSLTHSIIENITSRENYRISNESMTNFHTRMEKYDEILLALINDFEKVYSEVKG